MPRPANWTRRQDFSLAQCIPFIPEAQAVLDLVDQCPEQVQKGKFPVIAIEGLDATGKTTVTQSVSDSLKAVLLKSPPACISQWRKIFDDEPTIIRRAFYSLGNYIVASEIAKESSKSPVIVDRYWHSTATYAIATEVTGGLQHLPPAHHPIYQWPRDLLKPDLVLLLTVSPEERMHRIEGRGMERTREEAELEANSVFRQKYVSRRARQGFLVRVLLGIRGCSRGRGLPPVPLLSCCLQHLWGCPQTESPGPAVSGSQPTVLCIASLTSVVSTVTSIQTPGSEDPRGTSRDDILRSQPFSLSLTEASVANTVRTACHGFPGPPHLRHQQ
ncbi:hypothetical protein PANDA_010124 [Ailuropoda melanoleuca]|uniref:UMP-CMP kinase 2, mitochondrial n=1 Tax=Ailuropoda melanoleuca TaxID=9646 RepID=D2HGH1_AILME|nr:hypothetical protein PANDA_010124 [Ailuropoda melanoleuca]